DLPVIQQRLGGAALRALGVVKQRRPGEKWGHAPVDTLRDDRDAAPRDTAGAVGALGGVDAAGAAGDHAGVALRDVAAVLGAVGGEGGLADAQLAALAGVVAGRALRAA